MVLSKKRDRISFQIKELGVINIIISLSVALAGTIWAIYFENLTHSPSQVGFINTLFGVAGMIAFIALIPLIEKNSKTKLLGISVAVYAVSYFLFSFVNDIIFAVILGLIVYISASLRINVSGIILRNKSRAGQISKNTGFMYTLFNLSWFLGPLIAGFLSERYGINFVFIISGCLMFIAFVLLGRFKIKDSRKTRKKEDNLFKILKEYFSKRKFVLNYIVSGGINFWWAFIYIYIPIYIIESGQSSLIVGYFLSGVILPLILLEYFFGKVAGKTGFRKMFIRGYFILVAVSVLCFFIADLYAVLVLLVLGSVGAAMLEPTTEAHFFNIASKDEKDKYYGVYNTTIDINYAISLFLIAIVLKFLPFKYAFLFMGVVMGIFALISLGIKNIVEKR